MKRTLIKGGTIVTAVDTYAADLAIEGDKITDVFAPGAGPAGIRERGNSTRASSAAHDA